VISVLEAGAPEPGLHQTLNEGGVEVFPVVLPPRAYASERTAYRTHFSRRRPDIVHTHGYRTDVLAGAIAGRMKLPRVTTVHGFTGGDWKNRVYEFLQLRAFRRFESVVAVSEPLAAKLARRGVPPDRISVIPNAFDRSSPQLSRTEAREILGLPLSETVIGWVGRLSREKGLDVLIDALPLLVPNPVSLSVLGDGAELPALKAQAAAGAVAERIRWHGLIPNAGRLYRAFDVFVLSSRTEGTPISLFEAMAAEVPVVATAVGGVPHVLREAEGHLVPPVSPGALAGAIQAVLSDGPSARARVTRARARLEDAYSIEPWIECYDRLYRSLIPHAVGTPG
jgi:glycosyltransferase involved in cell wall biosynthesis